MHNSRLNIIFITDIGPNYLIRHPSNIPFNAPYRKNSNAGVFTYIDMPIHPIKFPVGPASGYLSGFRFPIFALLIDFCEIIALERIFRLVNFRKQLNSNKGYTKFQFEKVDSKLYVEVEIL